MEYDFSNDDLVPIDLQNAFFISDEPLKFKEDALARLGSWHPDSLERIAGMRDDVYPIIE
jgi:hypothetical protein